MEIRPSRGALLGRLAALLDPLGPGGSGRYRTAVFDYSNDPARPQVVKWPA